MLGKYRSPTDGTKELRTGSLHCDDFLDRWSFLDNGHCSSAIIGSLVLAEVACGPLLRPFHCTQTHRSLTGCTGLSDQSKLTLFRSLMKTRLSWCLALGEFLRHLASVSCHETHNFRNHWFGKRPFSLSNFAQVIFEQRLGVIEDDADQVMNILGIFVMSNYFQEFELKILYLNWKGRVIRCYTN